MHMYVLTAKCTNIHKMSDLVTAQKCLHLHYSSKRSNLCCFELLSPLFSFCALYTNLMWEYYVARLNKTNNQAV